MLQDTILRLKSIKNISSPIVICNEEHRFNVAEQLKQIDINESQIILEPCGKNTAPAALIAALHVIQKYPNADILILPSDNLIKNADSFKSAIEVAEQQSKNSGMITFGVKADKPETGYGYIKCGNRLSDEAFVVDEFVEKPSLNLAMSYIEDGNYLWNSGMFMFSAQSFIDNVKHFNVDMLTACELSLKKAEKDLDFIRLDDEEFRKCPSDSIDYAVMEKVKNAIVVPLYSQWSDLGSWPSIYDNSLKDKNNNVSLGDVITYNVTNTYIRSEERLVAAVGVDGLVIIETNDAILVCDKNDSQNVKEIVNKLRDANRSEHICHSTVLRPWGSYQCLDSGNNYQVKRIIIKPGQRISLQIHHYRSEHWVVVNGKANVTCGEDHFILNRNESTYIPLGIKHRLENVTDELLEIIEVQSGSYLGEDDIVRFDDDYQRI
jgi:mannose-1-phosphate guanylyltransferase/mannose-6-phosphate isomerase